ncbi:MAG: hypothetical protein IJD39_07510 [Clostridia bacterium]|nr:hypothetical protein [Clostridia bacterium]
MIGMPVMMDGKMAGSVLRGVLTEDGRALRGIVMRGGIKGARWLPREQIALIGDLSIIGRGATSRVPRDAQYRLFRVSDPEGARLGVVTDALLNEETMHVTALEISGGPLDDLTEGRWYATAFTVRPSGEMGHVTVPGAREEVTEQ